MGKEWLSWVGGGGGGGGGNSRSSAKRARGKMGAAGGCMFHLFHVHHHFHFPSTHRITSYPFLQEEPTTTTGLEAPRNSLELNEPTAAKQEQDLNFPVGIKIKTSKAKAIRKDEISSECDSPGTKTPSVVARLMGLDLLPECTSPSTTKSRKDTALLQIDAARSLPETPRTSSSSRKSDVDRHRLSLQIINKENTFSPSDDGGRRCKQDDSKRARSMGLDITNIHRNSDHSKKISKIVPKYGEGEIKQSNAPKVQRYSSSHDISVHQSRRVSNQIPLKESKRVRLKKLPASRREDGFVDSRERDKSHLAQKSCDILTVNGRVKIGARPLKKLPPKKSQVSEGVISWKSSAQLSSKASQSYSQLQLRQDKIPTTVSPCTTEGPAALHGGASPEHIQIVLKRTGIAKWHTPSQPIDPEIFHHLELKAAGSGGLTHRLERKLVFQLVDELLAEILTRRFKLNPWIPPFGDGGSSQLLEELCKKIGSFPAAKCMVLGDIDSLIDKDFCKAQWNGFWGEEEEMVGEIEGEIVEWLVSEAVAMMGGDAAEELVFVM